MKPNPEPSQEQIEGPAIIRTHHKRDRDISTVAGSPKAWRSSFPFEAYYDDERLQGGNPAYTAEDRYNAGLYYRSIYLASERATVDSTQALNVSRSSTLGNNNDAQQRAWDSLLTIESHLGKRDRIIIREVCGNDMMVPAAIKLVSAGYKDEVGNRMREACDALIEAIEEAKKNPRRFNMKVVA
jgi:hypothetical protein